MRALASLVLALSALLASTCSSASVQRTMYVDPVPLYVITVTFPYPDLTTETKEFSSMNDVMSYLGVLAANFEARYPDCQGSRYTDARTIYRIYPGAEPVTTSPYEILNGEPTAWSHKKITKSCWTFDETVSYPIFRGTLLCPQSDDIVTWQKRTKQVSENNFEVWCEGTYSDDDSPDDPCDAKQPSPVGNPVEVGTGKKLHTENDYASADGTLYVTRHYDSGSSVFSSILTTRLFDFLGPSSPTGCYGSFIVVGGEKQWACFTYSTRAQSQSYLWRDEYGRRNFFSGPAISPESRGSLKARIEKYVDAGGLIYWRAFRTDNRIDLYDAVGQLVSMNWSDGRRAVVTRQFNNEVPPSSQTVYVTDVFGRTLQADFDVWDQPLRLTDPAGQKTVYQYEWSGNICRQGVCQRLKVVTHPDGTQRLYHYDDTINIDGAYSSLNLTGITDEMGVRVGTYIYDALNRVVETKRAGDVDRYILVYGSDGQVSVANPYGATTIYKTLRLDGVRLVSETSQPAGAGCAAATSKLAFGTNNTVVSAQDFVGKKTCHTYDLSRNLETTRVEGISGNAFCSSFSPGTSLPTGVRRISSQWHPDWRLKTRHAEPGKITTWVYNGQPDPTAGDAIAQCAPASALLPNGKPIAVLCRKVEQATTDASGTLRFTAALSSTPVRSWQWEYNEYGQVISERDAQGGITTHTYYADTTAEHRRGDRERTVNAAGHVISYLTYDAHGQVLRMQDANGVVVEYAYDTRRRLVSMAVAGSATSYEYDAAGQLRRTVAPDGTYTAYEYDAAHRLTTISDGAGRRIEYTLDAAGHTTAESARDPAGVLKRRVAFDMDVLGRVQQAMPGGQ